MLRLALLAATVTNTGPTTKTAPIILDPKALFNNKKERELVILTTH